MTEAAQGQDAFTKAVAGDRAAFAELVRKHQAMVFSIALHSLRDAALAEELAQEVFLDFFNHLRDFQSAGPCEFWLRKVTSRRCIDYVRRRRRQISIALDDAPELSAPPVDADPFLVETLRKLTASLPEQARMVVSAAVSGGSRAGRDRRDDGDSVEQREKLLASRVGDAA